MRRTRTTLTAIVTALALVAGAACVGVVAPTDTAISSIARVVTVNEGDVRFKTTCKFDHSAQDDPIVNPNVPGGAAHMHDFIGAKGITAFTTTFAQLQAITSTTCNDPADHAGYWAPTVKVNNVQRKPTTMTAYYRLNGKYGNIDPFPEGLKVVAGHNMANMSDPFGVTGWQCNDTGIPSNTPVGCTQNLTMRINFPDCWDGVNLDSADHRSHMAYSVLVGSGPEHICPLTHPVPVPSLTTYYHYGNVAKNAVITISSSPSLEMGVHADFINGWETARQEHLIEKCLIGRIKCDSGGGD